MLIWQHQETVQTQYQPKKPQRPSGRNSCNGDAEFAKTSVPQSNSSSFDASHHNKQQEKRVKPAKSLQQATHSKPTKAPKHRIDQRPSSPHSQPRTSSLVREATSGQARVKASKRVSSFSQRQHPNTSSPLATDRPSSRPVSSRRESTDVSSVAGSKSGLLWGNLTRRAWHDYESSAAHTPIMRQVTPLLRATLVTGFGAGECTPWADANDKSLLSGLVENLWMEVACRNGEISNEIDEDVAEVPNQMEAKKVGCIPNLQSRQCPLANLVAEALRRDWGISRANAAEDAWNRKKPLRVQQR